MPKKTNSSEVVLLGNPNVGKSVIFRYLTDRYMTVSNYPGTTVEICSGRANYDHGTEDILDTPGINSLQPLSEDEVVTRDMLLKRRPRLVVQIADAKNLRRALFLSIQLAEMNVPFVLALNMMDEARGRGMEIDTSHLEKVMDVSVVATVAIHKKGLPALVNAIRNGKSCSRLAVQYPDELEKAVDRIIRCLPSITISPRAMALMLLSGDSTLAGWLAAKLNPDQAREIEETIRETSVKVSRSPGAIINEYRLRKATEIFQEVVKFRPARKRILGEFLSRISMHPWWGLLILLGVLYGLYLFVGVFGAGTLVDLLEERFFGDHVVPWISELFAAWVPLLWVRELFVGEYGLITMGLTYAIAIVLPVVATFFLAFGFLEDSGYLPRLAVMMNRVFKALGLNGKAVLPMVLGLGCDTMATLTTRILETRKERILVTLLLALGIPCSAQLGVILGLLGGLSLGAVLLWLFCISGVLVVVGYLASRVLPGERSDFILELPPIRLPGIMNIVIKTLARIEWYLKEAVPLFFLGTFLLFILAKTGALARIQVWSAPLVSGLLGLPEAATDAFLIGFLRRDYGAAGLFDMARQGLLSPRQIIISLVTITLFVPCIANFFVIIKERGWKTALAITGFIVPFAFLVGALLNLALP